MKTVHILVFLLMAYGCIRLATYVTGTAPGLAEVSLLHALFVGASLAYAYLLKWTGVLRGDKLKRHFKALVNMVVHAGLLILAGHAVEAAEVGTLTGKQLMRLHVVGYFAFILLLCLYGLFLNTFIAAQARREAAIKEQTRRLATTAKAEHAATRAAEAIDDLSDYL